MIYTRIFIYNEFNSYFNLYHLIIYIFIYLVKIFVSIYGLKKLFSQKILNILYTYTFFFIIIKVICNALFIEAKKKCLVLVGSV